MAEIVVWENTGALNNQFAVLYHRPDLVVSSTLALGITGTFLGDYFGILMGSQVEGCVSSLFFEKKGKEKLMMRCLWRCRFPFNVLRDPMCFAAGALW
jgi:phosphatidylethanolamine N-methyltransferase